jgi:hypothetical protein
VRAFFDESDGHGRRGHRALARLQLRQGARPEALHGPRPRARLFRAILSNRKKSWKFNMSPLFLEFLMGKRNYECTPWGSPAYNIFGWQKPCYLLQDGYVDTFKELMETTKWEEYGVASGNPKCANCMVSCGYEPTAVIDGFYSSRVSGPWSRATSACTRRARAQAAQRVGRRIRNAPWCRSPSPPALEETNA